MADASAQYKLRCSLDGHSMDVRAVTSAVFPVGGLISGSRDRSIKLWIPNEESNGFVEGTSMVGPTNFVASVCCMPPNADHPHGLIVAGSNDSVIYCYNPDSPKPIHTLEGHAATVCSVAAGKFGTLLSGSWDKTAKVWIKQKCVFTLSGHEAAVWSVQVIPDHGLMLTGSADKTIKSWRAGKCEKTFEGHTDCVRGLSVLNPEEFLSCSNDATIRRWSVMSGHCLQAYYGHTSFIYSVSVVPNTGGLRFVSSSEDRSICVWNVATDSDPCIQTIRLPAQSIWSVACTDNGDIISGSSDGVVRIFTTVPELQASVEEQKLLEEQVSKSTINADEIGDLKVSDLPSKEALYEPGKKDGHTKMIRDGAVVSAYQWSASEQRWLKIGDVVGADGSSKSNSGKTSFEGQDYDYVFSVDIAEGKPPLKLPYNVTEDPWFAAQKFIQKHNLESTFLEQVADFIMKNTKGVTLAQGSSASTSDPFTGGNRYVPGSGVDSSFNSNASDPFTGAGRYIPSYNNPQQITNGQSDPFTGGSRHVPVPAGNQYFPQKSYVKFDVANTKGIITKLREFSASLQPGFQLDEVELNLIEALTDVNTEPSDKHLDCLNKILSWPEDVLFPALDVLRLAVRNNKVVKRLRVENENKLIEALLSHLSAPSQANRMLVLRTLCNLFGSSAAEELLHRCRDEIIGKSLQSCTTLASNKNIQIALTTLLLNYSVLLRQQDGAEVKTQLMSAIVAIVGNLSEAEATFRILVCLGTIIHDDDEALDIARSFNYVEALKRFQADESKVGSCAGHLLHMLS